MIDGHKYPFVFLHDRERAVYRQYGMIYKEENIIGWRTVISYIKLRLSGYPSKRRKGSHRGQMGGYVVVDGEGKICYIYRSRYPEDGPEIDEILKPLLEHGK